MKKTVKNIIKGIGSTIEILPSRSVRLDKLSPLNATKSDSTAISKDWYRVGVYIKDSMKKVAAANEHGKI